MPDTAEKAIVRKAVKFLHIDLASLIDGTIVVSVTATTVDDEEAAASVPEIDSSRLATIDDVLALIGMPRARHDVRTLKPRGRGAFFTVWYLANIGTPTLGGRSRRRRDRFKLSDWNLRAGHCMHYSSIP